MYNTRTRVLKRFNLPIESFYDFIKYEIIGRCEVKQNLKLRKKYLKAYRIKRIK